MSDERLRQRARECETYGHVWSQDKPLAMHYHDGRAAEHGECQRCGDSGVFYGPWDWCLGKHKWGNPWVSAVAGVPVVAYRECRHCGLLEGIDIRHPAGYIIKTLGILPDLPAWAAAALEPFRPA